MIIDTGTTIIHGIVSGTVVQESHVVSGTVVTQFEGNLVPALSVQYDDNSPVFYDDLSYVLYEN